MVGGEVGLGVGVVVGGSRGPFGGFEVVGPGAGDRPGVVPGFVILLGNEDCVGLPVGLVGGSDAVISGAC